MLKHNKIQYYDPLYTSCPNVKTDFYIKLYFYFLEYILCILYE